MFRFEPPFSFEQGTVPLDDGRFLKPSEHAQERWVGRYRPQWSALGICFYVLYELTNERWVLLDCLDCTSKVIPSNSGAPTELWRPDSVSGRIVPRERALKFILDCKFDVPESLSDLIAGRSVLDDYSVDYPGIPKEIEQTKQKSRKLNSSTTTEPVRPSASPERPVSSASEPSSDTITIDEIRGKIDVAVLTIRMDEFRSILDRFDDRVMVTRGKNLYDFAEVANDTGTTTKVVMGRILEPGTGNANAIARNLIEDVDPTWLFLVGIAGGTPDAEYSLGDVVLAKRLHDFSVTAWKPDGTVDFAMGGGPMHQDVEKLLAHMPAISDRLGNWNSPMAIGREKPPVDLSSPELFYGGATWIEEVRKSLERNFPDGQPSRPPIQWEGSTADGSALMKNPDAMEQWKTIARDIRIVEMELGGVYLAARHGGSQNCRVLAVRALSDIVGYKREPAWTQYACESAAAFTRALIQTGVIHQVIPVRPQ